MKNRDNIFKVLGFSFFVFILGIFSINSSLHAEEGWATVDTRVLLMLHPQMTNFDYSNGRFFRKKLGRNDFAAVLKKLQTAKGKAAKESKLIKKEQKKALARRFQLFQKKVAISGRPSFETLKKLEQDKKLLVSALNELKKKKPTDRKTERLYAARKADLLKRISLIEDKLFGNIDPAELKKEREKIQTEIRKVDKEISELSVELRKTEEEALKPLYLTSSESHVRLRKIKTEISKLIKDAASESKISVVMDTSFAMRSSQRKDRKELISTVEDSPDVISSSLFHSFVNLSIDPRLKQTLVRDDGSKIPEEHLVVGRSLGMKNNLIQYLQFRNYMPEKVADFSHGRLLISGGIDLTTWVARKLFEHYKIPDSIKNSYMLAIRSYLNFNKEPFVREREY